MLQMMADIKIRSVTRNNNIALAVLLIKDSGYVYTIGLVETS